MKKTVYLLALLIAVAFTSNNCREVKKEDKMASKLERVADEVEHSGERAVEEVEGAADDIKEELDGENDDN